MRAILAQYAAAIDDEERANAILTEQWTKRFNRVELRLSRGMSREQLMMAFKHWVAASVRGDIADKLAEQLSERAELPDQFEEWVKQNEQIDRARAAVVEQIERKMRGKD